MTPANVPAPYVTRLTPAIHPSSPNSPLFDFDQAAPLPRRGSSRKYLSLLQLGGIIITFSVIRDTVKPHHQNSGNTFLLSYQSESLCARRLQARVIRTTGSRSSLRFARVTCV
ncbi:hypothetical protein BDR26DRAFT_890250 [Obelidium mucronatum]|nr:hypothetical protein BDR26DRAFT_890250 [Obelidium mucronatum]